MSKPRRPRDDFPSRRPAMSSGNVITSYVLARTNSPGCKINGSSPSAITSRVSSACSVEGSITEYLWFSKTRKNLSRRTSTEDGWIIASSNGSTPTRLAAISARISRSLKSTCGLYQFGDQITCRSYWRVALFAYEPLQSQPARY